MSNDRPAHRPAIFDGEKESKIGLNKKVQPVLVKGSLTRMHGRPAFEAKRAKLAALVRWPVEQVSDAAVIEWMARDYKGISVKILKEALTMGGKTKKTSSKMGGGKRCRR